ncbi:MAG: rhomboid family intramembrane serine protease [Candidatus Aminicenantes bacterium]|nr:MAG: rhomboid family intramembrane serine protease [Candidatus Aminicenantes bacterium]
MIFPIGLEGDKVRRIPYVTFTIIGLCTLMYIFTAGKVAKYEKQYYEVEYEVYEYYREHPYLEVHNPEVKKLFEQKDRIRERVEEIFDQLMPDKYTPPEPEEEEEPDEDIIKEEQEYFDKLVQDVIDARDSRFYYKWGFVPAKKTVIGYITHMFMHGGFWHLLINMIMLYIMGPFLEDVWGRPTYAVFYLVTGILAAQAFAMHYPNSMIPSIGASGAISGVMGGFLIRHWNVKIRYIYFFSLIIRGTFSAPAWVMMPLWLIREFVDAQIMDAIFPEGGGGVGHWAHIWGFIFGAIGGVVVKYLKIEEKYVAPKVEAETAFVDKSHQTYEEAMQLLNAGERDKAYTMLMDSVKKDPCHQDSVEALWNLSAEMAVAHEVAPYLTRLMEREAQQGHLDLALFHFRLLRAKFPDARISTYTKIMVMEQAANTNDADEAKGLFNEIKNEVSLSSPPGLLLNFCSAAVKHDLNFGLSLAPQAAELVLQHPEIPDTKKDSLKQQLKEIPKQQRDGAIKVDSYYESSDISGMGDVGGVGGMDAMGKPGISEEPIKVKTGDVPPIIPVIPIVPSSPSAPPASTAAGSSPSQPPPIPTGVTKPTPSQPPPIPTEARNPGEPEIPVRPGETLISLTPGEPAAPIKPAPQIPQKSMRVTKAVPMGVKEKKISLKLENMGDRVFPLEKVKALAVVKISPPAERPFLLIDLLVDDPFALAGSAADKIVIRTIRLLSTNFNPKKFVPKAQSPLEAFKIFSSALLKLSGAKPFPDLESVQLKKITTFHTIKDYENSLLEASAT